MTDIINDDITTNDIVEQPIKKKRGIHKKIVSDANDETVVTEKKKRGRPKKEPVDFLDYIKETFNDYVSVYSNLITEFINASNDIRINKNQWDKINKHVEDIREIMRTKSGGDYFLNKKEDYSYKSDSQWKGIDQVRENMRKKYVSSFYNNEYYDSVYKGYLIWQHLRVYISESSKESKI